MKAKIKAGAISPEVSMVSVGDIIEVELFYASPGVPASTEIVIARETGLLFKIADLEIAGYERDEEGRRVCQYCSGTNISPYERDGGSCPHCFGGYERE